MKILNFVYGSLIVFIICCSCNKDNYLNSGLHENNYKGTIMNYIDSRKDIFESLAQVIRLAGLEDQLNRENITFFAPGDQSINKAVRMVNVSLFARGKDTLVNLNQIDSAVWREFLSKYIVAGSLLSEHIPQIDTLNLDAFPGRIYQTISGKDMNLGMLHGDVEAEVSDGIRQTVKYAGYRQLYIAEVKSVSGTGNRGYRINSPVATSNLKTSNGVIHALQYRKHTFGFITQDFVRAVINKL